MSSRNLFLDLEAYGSDDEDFQQPLNFYDNEDTRAGDEDEEEPGEEEEEAGTLQAKDGEVFEDEDFPETFGPALFDSMEKRYNPEALSKLKTLSPVLLSSHDDLVKQSTLHHDLVAKALLLSKRKPLFWRIRCKAGRENEVVYNIMANIQPSANTLASQCLEAFTRYQAGARQDLEDALKEVLEVDTIPKEFQDQIDEAVAQRAQIQQLVPEPNLQNLQPTGAASVSDNLPDLLQYAQSDSITIPEAEKAVASTLGVDSIPPLWATAIGKATLEPDTDVIEALQALRAMKSDLVPSPTSDAPLPSITDTSTSKDRLLSAAWSDNENSYHVFSAFSVPSITGAVYLEAYLGKNPQSARIVDFLRQHPVVLKVSTVRLDQQSNRHQQQVWLQPVTPQDVANLLTMSPPSIKPLEWVRVTHSLYKDDVGLVTRRETSTGVRQLAILLVPRLHQNFQDPPPRPPHPNHPLVCAESSTIVGSTTPTSLSASFSHHSPEEPSLRKRKREEKEQAPQCLFDASLWPEGDDRYAWRQLGHRRYEMAGDQFDHGLLSTYLAYGSVTDIDVHMDISTRRLFQTSTHPLIQRVHMPLSENWVFLHDENVEVIYGEPLMEQEKQDRLQPYRRNGRVDQVERERCLIHFDDYDDDPYEVTTVRMDVEETDVWISKTNLRKKINVGDHVAVIAGDFQGHHGFVVSNWGLEVDIVDMNSEHKELMLKVVLFSHSRTSLCNFDLRYRIYQPVMVIKGLIKNRGFVRDVELYHRFKSSMRVLVEFDFISVELGANPRLWIDYGWVQDPMTGLPLHIQHPLPQRDARYWCPLKRIRAVSVPAPLAADSLQLDFVDPFHWTLDPRLNGKSFLARWEHSQPAMKDVIVTLDGQLNREVSLPADPQKLIKPQTNTRPLLVIRGEHMGKHLRQIYFRSQKGTQERLITASVFEPWGMPEEAQVEEHIVVQAEDCEDCAIVPSDPNKNQFAALMTSLKQIVLRPKPYFKDSTLRS
ncbi:hypothetical protein K435DRAFT_811120 [Dendrothele bispora CBS 962.96]|uniref:KOW domain-containing protein n=1 Tax=Dendrothele bispora (strain CBS 962.96) TaxID=1314807 RepID=A0A4S8KT96_DENBC|nr:hypothetical protein K435DRAFT_811120 [Dendrothele bispora CBS 962.96]